MYRKRSDYRTVALPTLTDEFRVAVDLLSQVATDSATFTDLLCYVDDGLLLDSERMDTALRWLVDNGFVSYHRRNNTYRAQLRLNGLAKRISPKPEHTAPQACRACGDGACSIPRASVSTAPQADDPPSVPGPSLRLLLLTS